MFGGGRKSIKSATIWAVDWAKASVGSIVAPATKWHLTPTRHKGRHVFGWFKSEQRERRKKVKLVCKYLEARARRFLRGYLEADETRKPQFYRAVEEAATQCQPTSPLSDLSDAAIAEAAADAAMTMVIARLERSNRNDRIADFVTDAYATVGVAYHRAAGAYKMDKDMQDMGTAAVHLLTMATSYMKAKA